MVFFKKKKIFNAINIIILYFYYYYIIIFNNRKIKLLFTLKCKLFIKKTSFFFAEFIDTSLIEYYLDFKS